MVRNFHRLRRGACLAVLVLVAGAAGSARGRSAPEDGRLRTRPAGAVSPAFAVERYEVAGNTLLDPAVVEAALAHATGPAVPLPEIRAALEALRAAYLARGHRGVAVHLPRQPLTGGVVRVEVREGGAARPAAEPVFDLRHFEIHGNTVFTAEELDALVGPLAGPAVTAAEFRAGLERLRAAYRERGWPAAVIVVPEQVLTDGRVVVEVREGSLAALPPPDPAPPEEPPAPRLAVTAYEVVGNTLLPPATVAAAFTNAVGPEVPLPDVLQAVGALQLAYRERGLATVAVTLPPQEVAEGVVRVEVTEGVLGEVVVTGQRHFSEANVRRALPSLRTNEVLNSQVLQRELDLANQNRDRQIFPVLGPGPEPGTSTLTLRVRDHLPLHGRAEVNNHATPGTPDWRINTSLQHNNLWQREHQLGLSYSFTPEAYKDTGLIDDHLLNRPLVASYGAYYRVPIGAPRSVAEVIGANPAFGFDEATRQFVLPPAGARPELTFFTSVSSSDTGVQAGPRVVITQTPLLTIVSQDTGRDVTETVGAGARFSLPRALSDERRLAWSFGPDWRRYQLDSYNTNNFIITTVITNAQGSQTIETRVASPQPPRRAEVQYLPLTAALDYQHATPRGPYTASLAVSGNFVGDDDDFAATGYSRSASALWARTTLALAHDRRLPGDWSILARLSGQAATGELIGNEQFALGGLNSVRGYLEGAEYGDAGWFGSLELRTPHLRRPVGVGTKFLPAWLRGLAFVDAGQRFLYDGDAAADDALFLWGAGTGASATVGQTLDLRVVVGWPLQDTPTTSAGQPRAYFSVGGQF